MYEVVFTERHKQGLEKLTGSNKGLVYTNERQQERDVQVDGERSETRLMWVYDVYEIEDARSLKNAKNIVIGENHPSGDELKILRQTLAKVLKDYGIYDMEEYKEFKAYNEFAEALDIKAIAGSMDADLPTEEEILEEAKAKMLAKIAEFNSSANVNAFTVGGNPMWLTFEQRNRLKSSIDAAEAEGRTEMSKSFGGVPFTYAIAVWKQMIAAVENYAGDCQNVTEQHIAAVAAMTTLEEVEAFDYTAGYPNKPAF